MPVSSKPRRRRVPRVQRPPSAHQVRVTFAPIDSLLAELASGEVLCTNNGDPIMPVWGGEMYEVGPALEGWINCWQRIVDGERLADAIDLDPLRELHDRLAMGMMLSAELVSACMRVTDACRAAYGRMTRARAKAHSLTELIAIEVEGIEDEQ